MTPGKKKCKMLREIRRRIADENDIPFVTEECKYKGDCKGTCPKCESELKYLEEQIEKRRALGKRATVAAVALGLAAGLSGCGQPSVYIVTEGAVLAPSETEQMTELDGEIAENVTESPSFASTVVAAEPSETEPEFELEGDVVYVPDADESAENGADGAAEAVQSNG